MALLLVTILALVNFSINTNAQDEEKEIIWDNSLETTGPVWIEYTCMEISCQGMELIINIDGEITNYSDTHRIEWSGFVNETIAWQVMADYNIDATQIKSNFIISNKSWYEAIDLPNNVPSPGYQGNYSEIETSSPCQMEYCNSLDLETEGIIYTGALDNSLIESNYHDRDAIRIVGQKEDAMVIKNFKSSDGMAIELWTRNISRTTSMWSPSMDRMVIEDQGEYNFEYPEGELWIRIVPTNVQRIDFTPYQFEIIRYDAESESPENNELTNPWTHGDALIFNKSYEGHIVPSDEEGDSIRIELGRKMIVWASCKFSDNVDLDIILHQQDGSEIPYLNNISDCPELIYSTSSTESIEFRITAENQDIVHWGGDVVFWEIGMLTDNYGDGNSIGDAPDFIWENGYKDSRWEIINQNITEYEGILGIGDNIDIFAFEITDENGSYVHLNNTWGEVSFQIVVLNQTTGAIINSTNGSMIIAPEGIHALRIEKINGESENTTYGFSTPDFETYHADNRELEDLSRMFRGLYLIVGIMFLTPMLIVIWWNRDNIFKGEKGISHIEEHERRMLNRLKSRISEDLDKELLMSALHQLGDSPWDSVIEEWGKPLLRHMTDQIEICLWKVKEQGTNILIGIRVANDRWNMATIRVYSMEGSGIIISKVNPDKMFQGDEVYLDSLIPRSNIFLKLTLDNNPSNIGFQLSGLVNREPMAASSNKTISWNEEE